MARTRIKICGIRDVDSALAAAEAGADAIGFVFAPRSPRTISPEAAWQIASYLPPFITKVGVFVDASSEEIDRVREVCPFDYAQLHGSESAPLVRELGPWVIKSIRFDPLTIESEFKRWSVISELDAVLVDGSAGGQGVAADWEHLAACTEACLHPLILAGGLTPENVSRAIDIVRPWAVDVSSGVESEPGIKDPRRIEAFCAAVREADKASS